MSRPAPAPRPARAPRAFRRAALALLAATCAVPAVAAGPADAALPPAAAGGVRSPDGALVAYVDGGRLLVFTEATGETRTLFDPASGEPGVTADEVPSNPAFASDCGVLTATLTHTAPGPGGAVPQPELLTRPLGADCDPVGYPLVQARISEQVDGLPQRSAPAAATAPDATAATTPAGPLDTTAPALRIGTVGKDLAVARRRGLRVAFRTGEAVQLKADVILPSVVTDRMLLAATAPAEGPGRSLGGARIKQTATGDGAVRLRFNYRALRALKPFLKLTATVRLIATDAAGNETTAYRRVVLRQPLR